MNQSLLVAVQLSSLSPSSLATSIPLQTSRQKAPLPAVPKDSDPISEHASYSSVLDAHETGTILLRVLHGGLIIELMSLTSDVAPIRFVFPAPVLPHPAVFAWHNELHVLAMTSAGSLYRVVVPIENSIDLWRNHSDQHWYHEHIVSSLPDGVEGVVHVQGIHTTVVGLANGSILRLECESLGHDGIENAWTETTLQHASFLSSLTSFIPVLHPSTSNASEIVSIATHPWPTDLGHICTLSRDRTLRLWKPKFGCVASRSLSHSRDLSPSPGPSTNGVHLLDSEVQNLVRVFSTPNAEEPHILVFTPTPSSSTSGGSFHLFSVAGDQLSEERTIECPKSSARCHLQDFKYVNSKLYALWDRQGQSVIEYSELDVDGMNETAASSEWFAAAYPNEPELTPAYLEELLLYPGSLTERFFEALMRPGLFSALTLRTAIDQYTAACLSLPGAVPPQLATTYATVTENIAAVVGCTVNLLRDPNTGALQHAKYWNALKRDWEGFIARCREIERSARWPLVLGQGKDDIIVVERERVGFLVKEDGPLWIRRALEQGQPLGERSHDILELMWTVRSKLNPQGYVSLENWMSDIMHQEIPFAIADLILDQVNRDSFIDYLDEGFVSWVFGRLQSISDLPLAVRSILDVIGDFDVVVKREEIDSATGIPPPRSQWFVARTATYVAATVQARYELCLSLIALLFVVADYLPDWEPSVLAEVFAVYRGVAMLRQVSRQPAGELNAPKISEDAADADEVIARMRDMQVSRNMSQFVPTLSLFHRLVMDSGDPGGIQGAPHRFLDSLGLLQSSDPASATRDDVLFCERLRRLKYYDVAEEMLGWLPRTPSVIYVHARLWLDIGRVDDAAYQFEKLAGSFGTDTGLSIDDREGLMAVLPQADCLVSDFAFYLHISMLFNQASQFQHVVLFTNLALSMAPPGEDTTGLWLVLIKNNIDLQAWDDLYTILLVCPYEQLKREFIGELVYKMCEANAVGQLMSYNFAGLADEVEDALSFKARNVDPRQPPFYSKILYTWYINRGDYRNAALAMYQLARKLQDLMAEPELLPAVVEEQLEAYGAAMNALSLLDQKDAWVVLPIISDDPTESRKRRKLSKYIPEDRYSTGTHNVEMVDYQDMRYDYALLSARIEAARSDPSLLRSGDFLLPPDAIVFRLAQANRFNTAMAAARSLKVDMSDLFSQLTSQCLRLVRNPDAVIQEDTSDWLLTDQVSSWSGTPAERGWRYLRQALERHDNAGTDFKYTKAVMETLLTFDRASSPPPWLIRSLEDHCHEHLIRAYLRYEGVADAVEHTLSLLRKADARVARDSQKHASATWLPYTLIDQVLVAAAGVSPVAPKLSELKKELASRVQRMQKLSK
ncbi:hypothetical protein HGRIS_009844 [Hohenbuehelia grisea]|uniref:Nuclear pore complex protein Nup160 n=1 Tax=Hohenbuehelia grisea TaxID=104357 RepID=A0ABR3J2H5_9AGAR